MQVEILSTYNILYPGAREVDAMAKFLETGEQETPGSKSGADDDEEDDEEDYDDKEEEGHDEL